MESKSKSLRSGYTTGACAAAAAKAAASLLLRSAPAASIRGQAPCGVRSDGNIDSVDIPFPDGSRVTFSVRTALDTSIRGQAPCGVRLAVARASVIKDAGDDPDVTHGAEIAAEARLISDFGLPSAGSSRPSAVVIRGGKGVGTVTKPGLAVPVGEPAINPVPRRMIVAAVQEAVSEFAARNPQSEIRNPRVEITISVPAGEELAKKTLNHRLGIVGGISILGTTGIVKPLSEEAWTATISASFDVAKALGLDEVVISTGRTSEKAHQERYGLPAEAYAMMGDYVDFSLRTAAAHGFRKVHLCAQWAKMIKIAMAAPQTHVRHGALEAEAARDFLNGLGIGIPMDKAFNTTREICEYIMNSLSLTGRPDESRTALEKVCGAAKACCEQVTGGIPVAVHLVSYEGAIIAGGR